MKSGFSILNGSWVTSTANLQTIKVVQPKFQYPQRIVGDFNQFVVPPAPSVRVKFQYPQRIVGDFNLAQRRNWYHGIRVSVSSTDRG